MDEVKQPELAYPSALLPKTIYVREIDISTVYKSGKYFTQRRASCSAEECVDPFGQVTFKSLYRTDVEEKHQGEDLIGMSLNMMGSPHLPEYGKWIQMKSGSKYWDGKEVKIEEYADSYIWKEDQAAVHLDATSLEGLEIPYCIYFADRSNFEKFKNVPGVYDKAFSRTTGYNVIGNLRHFHEPTFLNYWHVELWVYHKENDYKSKNIKNNPDWKLKLQHSFLELVRANASIGLPEHDEIPPESYLL